MLTSKQLAPNVTLERYDEPSGGIADDSTPRFRFTRIWRPTLAIRPIMSLLLGLLFARAAIFAPFEPAHPVVILVFRALIGALGVLLAYGGIAEGLNRTVVTVGPQYVSIRHRPVPWRGTCDVALAEVVGARVGSHSDDYETTSTVYLFAGLKEIPIFPNLREQDAYGIANALNTAIYEIRQSTGVHQENVHAG